MKFSSELKIETFFILLTITLCGSNQPRSSGKPESLVIIMIVIIVTTIIITIYGGLHPRSDVDRL